jgi:peptidoglycan/LPS O-acetylase OafA/YrhL
MFGTLRLVLAAMVALSHIGGNFGNLWNGVVAVVIFYMISGYAMTGLLQSRFPRTKAAPTFYLERIVRLAPQYYFWLVFALFTSLYLKWYPYSLNMKDFIPYGIFAYFTVVPLGLQSYLGSVNTLILPQATTLGIEITLYVFSPWILKSRKLSWIAAMICLGIFAATALEILPENIFTYFTSPGPMIFYLLGSFLYRKDWTSLGIFSVALISILLFGLPQRFNMEFLLGVIVGLPIMFGLMRFPPNKFDLALGDASYGLFLGHGVIFSPCNIILV